VFVDRKSCILTNCGHWALEDYSMKSIAVAGAVAGALALLAAVPAQAAVISFANFDDLGGGAGASFFNVAVADGWIGGADLIEIQHNSIAGDPFSSPNLVELDTFGNSSMFQSLAAGHYTVDWEYSPRPGIPASSNGVTLSIGSTLLDSVTGDGAGNTVWGARHVDFTTTGGALTFAAIGTSDSLGGYLDDITISELSVSTHGAVPEPATWALMIGGFGMAGAALRRRRSMRAAA
jgi:PEP-CTERM motif-containing protein